MRNLPSVCDGTFLWDVLLDEEEYVPENFRRCLNLVVHLPSLNVPHSAVSASLLLHDLKLSSSHF